MVLTSSPLNFTSSEPTITAISEAGIFSSFFGQKMSIASDITPTSSACQLMVPMQLTISLTLSMVSMGLFLKVRPMKSFICPRRIVTAIPKVNPVVIVPGIYLMRVPKRQRPMMMRIMPAMIAEIARPSMPSAATMPATVVANAAVGPAICTRLPPKNETMKPAIIAVYRPCSGPTPDASASAIESGRAMIATMIPAMMSLMNCSLV